jgi:hypothetical protein
MVIIAFVFFEAAHLSSDAVSNFFAVSFVFVL